MTSPLNAATSSQLLYHDKLDAYKRHLQTHDWHFQHSDDQSVWRAGRSSLEQLVSLRHDLDPLGETWNEYATEEYKLKCLPHA